MKSGFRMLALIVPMVVVCIHSAGGEDVPLNVDEFRQLFNNLLAGKTLET